MIKNLRYLQFECNLCDMDNPNAVYFKGPMKCDGYKIDMVVRASGAPRKCISTAIASKEFIESDGKVIYHVFNKLLNSIEAELEGKENEE